MLRATGFFAILSLLSAGGCGQETTSPSPLLSELFSGNVEILDLTHAIAQSNPSWSGQATSPFVYDTLSAHDSGSPGMGAYHVPEHFGTHLDAPIHSADGQPSVDELTPRDLFGPAAVIDVAERCAAVADYLMTKDDLLAWENEHGILPDGAVVLMYTGWSKKWIDEVAYRNADSLGQMHFPGFSAEAARFLIEEREIIGIGIDNLSVDAATADGFPVHGIVNGAGKFQLENVANLHLMPESGSFLIVAPIKLEGGSGGQVRIFAAVP